MKSAILALAGMIVAAPLAAQTAAPTAPPVATAAPAPAASSKYTLDTPIETIAADPAGKTVLDADFPGMTGHPMYDSFKSMTLTQVQPMSQGHITDEQMAKAKVDLAALK